MLEGTIGVIGLGVMGLLTGCRSSLHTLWVNPLLDLGVRLSVSAGCAKVLTVKFK